MDETTVTARLEALDRRVARLGAWPPSRRPFFATGVAAGRVPAGGPRAEGRTEPAGAGPRRPRPPAVAPAAAGPGVETWLGSVLLGRVGIAAVLLAAAYFAQLAYGHVSDPVKVLSLYALAGALWGAGRLLVGRVADRYVGLLWGGCAAVAYLAGLAATLRYQLVLPWVGMGMLAGAVALGQVLAHRLRQPVLAVVAVASAQAAPLLLGVAQDPAPFVLVYAALVHAWARFTEIRFGWRAARAVALLGATAVGIAWALPQATGSLLPALAVQAYVLLLLAPEILAILRDRPADPWQPVVARAMLGLAAIHAITWADRLGVLAAPLPAGFPTGVAVAWMSAATLAAGRARGEGARGLLGAFSGVGALLLVVAAPRLLESAGVTWTDLRHVALLGAVALLALLAGRRTGAGDGGAVVAALLCASWAGGAPAGGALDAAGLLPVAGMSCLLLGRHVVARVLGLLLAAGAVHLAILRGARAMGWAGTMFGPTSGWLALALLAPAALLLLGEVVARRRGDGLVAGAVRFGLLGLALLWIPLGLVQSRVATLPPPLDPHTASALGLAAAALAAWRGAPRAGAGLLHLGSLLPGAAVALALSAGGREVFLATRDLPEAWPAVAMSVYLTVAAGTLLAAGFRWSLAGLRWTAIALFGLVVGKVGLHDLAGASLPLRVLVTGLLGLVLLASAFAYSRRRRAERSGGPGAPPEGIGAPPTASPAPGRTVSEPAAPGSP